jgi:hypothetical protein
LSLPLSHLITDDIGNRFIFAVLASSASYIAVPARWKLQSKSKSWIFLPMALAYTFLLYYIWNAYIPFQSYVVNTD